MLLCPADTVRIALGGDEVRAASPRLPSEMLRVRGGALPWDVSVGSSALAVPWTAALGLFIKFDRARLAGSLDGRSRCSLDCHRLFHFFSFVSPAVAIGLGGPPPALDGIQEREEP